MTCEINKMASTYTLSQQLVHDLGHFIGVILKKEKLSSNAEKLRSQLHHSLQSFTVPEIEVPEQEEEYEDPEPIRVCSQLSINSMSGQCDDGSKINITLNELKKISTKQGPLWRKEKGILREIWRKYLAGIYEQKLILFYSEKDVKPTTCINIQGYVARPAPDIQKDVKKKDITFELICPGKKDYQFFARTAKDMEQWVAIICQTSIQHIDVSSPPRRASDHRLVISTDDSEMDDETSTVEEFYDDIVDSKHIGTRQASPEHHKPAPSATSKKDNEEEIPQEEDYEEEELYNDVEEYEPPSPKPDIKPMIWHTEQKFDIKDRRSPVPIEPVDDEEEEIYHDIVEYQNKLLPKPVVIMKSETDKPPPLPARRPLPSIPKDEPSEEEEEEENYEDITTPIQSQMKQPEQNLQVSENKIREEKCEVEEFEEAYEVEDFEETYDDIGNPDPKPEVTTSQVEVDEEVEEIYDDVGDSETSPQKNDLNESAKSINNGQNNDYKTGEIRNENKTSGINEKEPINITINVCTKQVDENNQAIKKCSVQVTKSIQNFVNNAGNTQSFLQRQCLEQKGNSGVNMNLKHPTSQNEISKQTTDITDTEKTNTLQNQISKQNKNVQNITNKFNQPKNVSFLHRHSSQEGQVNVQSILQKLQSKTTGSEGNVTSQISNNPKSTAGTLQSNSSDMDSEKNTANFQNAFKKIEASLADGGKPIGGHMLKPSLPINPNKLLNQSTMSPSGESPSNSLRNIQNRPLPPKPTLSSETSEFSFNKSPASRAPEVSLESPTRSLTNSRNEYSLEPNSMLNKISVSSRESSPMPPRNKPNLSDKPKNVTMLVRTPSESSKMSPNRTKNRPNGIPVSIPNIPDLEPPKLPPRSYLK